MIITVNIHSALLLRCVFIRKLLPTEKTQARDHLVLMYIVFYESSRMESPMNILESGSATFYKHKVNICSPLLPYTIP